MDQQKGPATLETETARVRGTYNGRQCACRQATGKVLEVAIGTGRNPPAPRAWSWMPRG